MISLLLFTEFMDYLPRKQRLEAIYVLEYDGCHVSDELPAGRVEDDTVALHLETCGDNTQPKALQLFPIWSLPTTCLQTGAHVISWG